MVVGMFRHVVLSCVNCVDKSEWLLETLENPTISIFKTFCMEFIEKEKYSRLGMFTVIHEFVFS